jgi:hypothetical protein
MKSLLMIVLVLTLCSLSFLAGRNTTTTTRSFSNQSASHTNELDDLQQELASQK